MTPARWAVASVSILSTRTWMMVAAPWNVRAVTVEGRPGRVDGSDRDVLGAHQQQHAFTQVLACCARGGDHRSGDLYRIAGADDTRQLVHRADEAGDERARRVAIHLGRRRRAARAEPCDMTPTRSEIAERLLLVVGDEQRRDAERRSGCGGSRRAGSTRTLASSADSGSSSSSTSGWIGQRPGQRDALLLAARELVRVALGEMRELHELEHLLRPAAHGRAWRSCGCADRSRRCAPP